MKRSSDRPRGHSVIGGIVLAMLAAWALSASSGCHRSGMQDVTLGGPDLKDTDGDGILDAMDKCPILKETQNQIDDSDGCPEEPGATSSASAVASAKPAPTATATAAAKPDAPPKGDEPKIDGSAAKAKGSDIDADGIADQNDQCPADAEDKDGFDDADGCPDPDNDADGVPDPGDKCPDAKGPKTKQGCP